MSSKRIKIFENTPNQLKIASISHKMSSKRIGIFKIASNSLKISLK
jgi:hypothetical protein